MYKEEIEKHINNCFNNFVQNTSKLIDSILNRHQDPVVFHNIKTEDTIVTEPKQIKEEQCLDFKSESTIPWFYLPYTIRTIPRRRQPNWYRQIVEIVQEVIESQAIVPIRPNPAYTHNNTTWKKKE
ncbi:33957_t:CDS:2 [Gigaspora margarita]|uniref:33957_t:CDS:1 n=1 Tax=Gigaspora margarita TaxID=4874 RepID=A0ABN7UTC3_GIGMA|nr:33957_t:CDS:2 [Gigaspora margarita]